MESLPPEIAACLHDPVAVARLVGAVEGQAAAEGRRRQALRHALRYRQREQRAIDVLAVVAAHVRTVLTSTDQEDVTRAWVALDHLVHAADGKPLVYDAQTLAWLTTPQLIVHVHEDPATL